MARRSGTLQFFASRSDISALIDELRRDGLLVAAVRGTSADEVVEDGLASSTWRLLIRSADADAGRWSVEAPAANGNVVLTIPREGADLEKSVLATKFDGTDAQSERGSIEALATFDRVRKVVRRHLTVPAEVFFDRSGGEVRSVADVRMTAGAREAFLNGVRLVDAGVPTYCYRPAVPRSPDS